ncbi:MAG: hypothetical protein OET79_15975 [Nitrospirota bacterium]|nr:hypothetical protein [Nitrospirota bacterium]
MTEVIATAADFAICLAEVMHQPTAAAASRSEQRSNPPIPLRAAEN